MKIFLKDIKERFPEFEFQNYDENAFFTGFCYDSRDVTEGDLYIPIVGERFDGHAFVVSALENGCSVSLCESTKKSFCEEANGPIILVDSIEEGLMKILNYSIGYIKKPVVAITGSTGKSTTRRMIVHIVEKHLKVLSSSKYNTVWGNARLLGQYANEDVIVLECGMDRVGEIAWHVNSVDPDIGVLLNVCDVHAEKVGGIENVFKEKKDLADYMERTGKPLVLNIDDERLRHILEAYNKEAQLITYGQNPEADFVLSDIVVDHEGTHFKFRYYDANVVSVDLSVYGEGFAYDAMAAIIVANELGVSIADCVKNLRDYENQDGRFQVLEYGDLVIVNDGYNANPVSMKMALETFSNLYLENYYTIAILGDMRELGDVSDDRHKEIADLVKEYEFNEVYLIGDLWGDSDVGEKIASADEVAALLNAKLQGLKNRKVAILLKGSHRHGLYQVPDFLKKLGAV
ncbi:MAG TPA: UDP-N-acetylmuramoyl-tripeptide--D-alanyl-D-alanine ligase [Candidatus Dojkabacteria bacterium]|nr:UDP-N-acetylmuramoyl-tripeptide--D-alanyl-D-alanine ligase [Candidatus Dojkabacteria bacterium]